MWVWGVLGVFLLWSSCPVLSRWKFKVVQVAEGLLLSLPVVAPSTAPSPLPEESCFIIYSRECCRKLCFSITALGKHAPCSQLSPGGITMGGENFSSSVFLTSKERSKKVLFSSWMNGWDMELLNTPDCLFSVDFTIFGDWITDRISEFPPPL